MSSFHSLAGRGQMHLSIHGRSHLFCQHGAESGTIAIVNHDTGSPLAHMVRRGLGHAAGHAGHEPRRTVLGVIWGNRRVRGKGIVTLGQGMLNVVASRQGLHAQNVVQMKAFVARNGGYNNNKKNKGQEGKRQRTSHRLHIMHKNEMEGAKKRQLFLIPIHPGLTRRHGGVVEGEDLVDWMYRYGRVDTSRPINDKSQRKKMKDTQNKLSINEKRYQFRGVEEAKHVERVPENTSDERGVKDCVLGSQFEGSRLLLESGAWNPIHSI
jgi:hypothetical protein